jgi:UDP-N-acetylglucosamine acyltransferase
LRPDRIRAGKKKREQVRQAKRAGFVRSLALIFTSPAVIVFRLNRDLMSIDSTSIVSPGACLAPQVSVGPFAVVEHETRIGERAEIRSHAIIKRFTDLGPDNIIYEAAILGGEPQDLGFVDCESYLRVGANNRIREGVTIHRGTAAGSATLIGSGCFIMAYAHVAHNCRLGDRVIIANNVALAGYVEIEDDAFISGGVVVHQFCRIGRLAMIGGNSKVVQDCLPFVITDGVPARARGLNIVGLRRAGYRSSDIRDLKEAYRILLRSGLALEDGLSRLSQMTSPLVACLLDFARDSRRGFCHEQRSGARD